MNLLEKHFETIWETIVLLIIYIFGALILAWKGDVMALSMWITGGAVIGALLRMFQTGQRPPNPPEPPQQ
jgi:hypothetical protein